MVFWEKWHNLLKAGGAMIMLGWLCVWTFRPDPEIYQWSTTCLYSRATLNDKEADKWIVVKILDENRSEAISGRYATAVADVSGFIPSYQAEPIMFPGFGQPPGTPLPFNSVDDQHLLIYECMSPGTWEYLGETTILDRPVGDSVHLLALKVRSWSEAESLVKPVRPAMMASPYSLPMPMAQELQRRLHWQRGWETFITQQGAPTYPDYRTLRLSYTVLELEPMEN